MRKTGFVILLLMGTAAGAEVPEAQGLYGAPTMTVAQQLGRKGFQMGRTYSSRGVVNTYFIHPNTGRCLMQTARNNRTISIDERQREECRASPQGENPGYRPGPGAADIYAEFIGMRGREAERELRRRGYRQSGGGGGIQYWWHRERALCASLFVTGGYVRQMVEEDPRACGQEWRPTPR